MNNFSFHKQVTAKQIISTNLLSSSSSLMVLHTFLDLGLLDGFVTVNFSGVGSVDPRSTPNLEDQGLHFVCALPFDLSVMVALPRV
jgi:hypothetical protein